MPNFERVFDQMRVDFAETPEEKARAIGFIEGKTFARKQILYVGGFIAGLWLFAILWGYAH